MYVKKNYCNEKVEAAKGDIAAPVFAYIGESGPGKDRRIKLEGATVLAKMLDLYKAHTYASIGPAEGSREWNKLEDEDKKLYAEMQAKAKKLKTFKGMGDYLSELCSGQESILFAIRQGDAAVWTNPEARKELRENEWHGVDKYWLEDACHVWGKSEGYGDSSSTETKPLYPKFEHSDVCYSVVIDGKIFIGDGLLKRALREGGVSADFLAKAQYDVADLTKWCGDDPIGTANIDSWGSPSQYFEDPGAGGYTATINMGTPEDCKGFALYFLQYFVEIILDKMAGDSGTDFTSWGVYDASNVPDILKEASEDPKVQATLKAWDLTNEDLEILIKAPLITAAFNTVGDALWALDGTEEKN